MLCEQRDIKIPHLLHCPRVMSLAAIKKATSSPASTMAARAREAAAKLTATY